MLSADMVMHPHDKAALKTLKAIPGFSMIVKKFLSVGYEKMQYGMNMASNIRLSPQQLPEIYNHLPPICEKLGIDEPEFYLQMDPSPNAFTFGDTKVFITVTSGLIEYMEKDEIDAILAHECGHILCHHVLYHTMAQMITALSEGVLGVMIKPIEYSLLYWDRMSEFSSDRVAALITNPAVVSRVMARLSGGPKNITENIDFEEWAKQAAEYEKIKQDGMWNKTLQLLNTIGLDHPFSAVRVSEIKKWGETDDYLKTKNMLNSDNALTNEKVCPKCGCEVGADWKFCRECGEKI
ncbi:MAG: M48 family metalloprotease [Acidaminococcaceae bacterium]|nr:M48 family metalloprotease [Acidaminococcaceae bacterium]